jgi:HAD superfamily hydrolase (TIGR01450 family)
MDFGVPTDVWGNSATELKNKKLFLFDMDGTIYEEDTLFDGTSELLEVITQIGGRYVFITNNSSKSVEDYIDKVGRLGIKADCSNFFTSAQATALYLKKEYKGKKIYCQGTKSLVEELLVSGIRITENVEDDVDVVLVGFDTEMTSEKLRKTCELLQRDIPFIATNPDLRCPVNFGFIPDCGSICNMIMAATDRRPIYIGKPERTMVDIVRNKFGYHTNETVVIGDRLYTDIASGLNAGVTSICVLTGEATKEDIKNGDIKPTLTFGSVKDIWEILQWYAKETVWKF